MTITHPALTLLPIPVAICFILSVIDTFIWQLTYGGLKWKGEFQVNERSRERSSFSVQPEKVSDSSAHPPPGNHLLSEETHDLVVQKEVKGTWHLSVFSPYWMINKTFLTLQYNVSQLNIVHKAST